MKYMEERPKIKSGDVLAWSSPGFINSLIKGATQSTWTHVGIAWVVGGRVFVLEAFPRNGVRIQPLSKELPFYHLRSDKFKWTKDMEAYALERVGESYSVLEAIRGFFGVTKKDSKWECAEYVQEILAHADLYALSIKPTPHEIVDYCLTEYKATISKVDK